MKVKYLYQGNIYKNFILFAFPMVITGVLSQLYNTVDTIIAGAYLGDKALGAIGALSPFITFLSSFIYGCGCGFGIYVALLYGKKEFDKLIHAFNSFIVILLGICLVVTLFSLVGTDLILDIFKVDEVIRNDAGIYFKVYMIGFFAIIMNSIGVYVLNALSSGTFPLYMSIISSLCNIGGNILTIVVFKMGVFGIALSSVISASIVMVCYFIRIWRFGKALGVKNLFGLDFHALRLGSGYIIPPTFQQLTMYTASMLISPIVNGFGYEMTSAYTIVSKVYDFIASIYQNSSKTLGNYVAQCIGAKKFENIRKSLLVAILQAFIFILPFIVTFSIIPDIIASLFLSGEYAVETFDSAVLFIRYFLPFVLFNMLNNVFHNMYRGLKDKILLIASSTFGAIVRLVFTYILAGIYGMTGFYIAWAISWILEVVFSAILYFTNVWIPKEYKGVI